ncbi:hypothetical protein [Streptomyces acidiscabies]|uniref:hypothetical protein n=1 Tax=Streptomyces acidiscabies TaxID=42234 RepID=UPI0038F710DC
MGVFVSVRGWLECDDRQLAAVHDIVRAADEGFYRGGWSFPAPINWTRYAFFGADLRAGETPWLLDQLRQIAELPASDADGDLVTGFFLATHEVEGASQWQIRDGDLHSTPAPETLRYLDL